MKQNVSWPIALLIIGALVLVVALVYHRAAVGGSEARISPQFLKMSPAEQRDALIKAELARRRRGAPPSPPGQ
jgi:hypothetical protein